MSPRRGRRAAYLARQRLAAQRTERAILAELERRQAGFVEYLLAGIRHGEEFNPRPSRKKESEDE
jgi:hypothetical protein